MVGPRESRVFHTDTDENGRPVSAQQRERLLKPYLPPTPQEQNRRASPEQKPTLFQHKRRVRPAIRHLIHSLLFHIIHTFFSIYVRLRQIYHAIVNQVSTLRFYHHRTPEFIKRDVKGLSKVPKHLSVILQLPPEGSNKDGLETLLDDACEIAAWSASAGVPLLSIYERSGQPLR